MKPLLPEELHIKPISQLPKWDDFVAAHPAGTVFHTRSMVSAMNATPLYEPLAIAVVNTKGDIVGMLVSTKISMPKLLPDKLTARSVFFSEPLCVAGAIGREAHFLLLAEHDRQMQDQVVFAEIRPMSGSKRDKSHYTKLSLIHI